MPAGRQAARVAAWHAAERVQRTQGTLVLVQWRWTCFCARPRARAGASPGASRTAWWTDARTIIPSGRPLLEAVHEPFAVAHLKAASSGESPSARTARLHIATHMSQSLRSGSQGTAGRRDIVDLVVAAKWGIDVRAGPGRNRSWRTRSVPRGWRTAAAHYSSCGAICRPSVMR